MTRLGMPARKAALAVVTMAATWGAQIVCVSASEPSADGNGRPRAVSIFYGTDFARNSHGYFLGGTIALNGDLGKSGFVLKGNAGLSNYDYLTTTVPGGEVEGESTQVNGLVGYQFSQDRIGATIAIGADYQNIDLSPDDPGATTKGSETGFIVSGDLYVLIPFAAGGGSERGIKLDLGGSYSTAFDSYWSRLRLGYDTGKVSIGPELAAMGGEDYEAQRVGGYVTYSFDFLPGMGSEISFSVGHQFVPDQGGGGVNRGGGEGLYATMSSSVSF